VFWNTGFYTKLVNYSRLSV